MDIQKLIADNTDCGDGALGLDNDGRIWLLAHIAELQQRIEKAEAQLAERDIQKSQWASWANEASAEVDRLRAQLAELTQQQAAAWLMTDAPEAAFSTTKDPNIARVWRKYGRNIQELYTRPAPPAPVVVKRPSLSVLIAALDEYEKHADDCPELGMLEAYKILLAEYGGRVEGE